MSRLSLDVSHGMLGYGVGKIRAATAQVCLGDLTGVKHRLFTFAKKQGKLLFFTTVFYRY